MWLTVEYRYYLLLSKGPIIITSFSLFVVVITMLYFFGKMKALSHLRVGLEWVKYFKQYKCHHDKEVSIFLDITRQARAFHSFTVPGDQPGQLCCDVETSQSGPVGRKPGRSEGSSDESPRRLQPRAQRYHPWRSGGLHLRDRHHGQTGLHSTYGNIFSCKV